MKLTKRILLFIILSAVAFTAGITAAAGGGYILGDSDGDGRINVKDATAIQKHLASLLYLSEEGKLSADVEEQGKDLNILCATYIQKYLASIPQKCAVGALRFI